MPEDADARVTEGSVAAGAMVLRGNVQGRGIRPAIARLAASLSLRGFVMNTAGGVAIRIQGAPEDIARFQQSLDSILPMTSDGCEWSLHSVLPGEFSSFEILTCQQQQPTATPIPRDLAACSACLRELRDPTDRRYRYQFSSCTHCGPRYSIIRRMPWERPDTAMQEFRLCPDCNREYRDPTDRRFHAQTVTCSRCGPRLYFRAVSAAAESRGTVGVAGTQAVAAASALIRSGGIVALKGLGGYQLLCDATSESAVRRLRQRKRRPAKPFPVMITSHDLLSRTVTDLERGLLESAANPVVVLDEAGVSCPGGRCLAPSVNPGLDSLGVILPTTPLHWLLAEAAGVPLVLTSGNIDAEPLAFQSEDGDRLLQDLADGCLDHDREIERPVDDSVVRVMAGQCVTLRAARGVAPLPLKCSCQRSILATGGDQKVSLAIASGHQVLLGPHIGDMLTTAGRRRFADQAQALQSLCGSRASVIAHDLHPDYFTSRWAGEQSCRTIAVQHHHAHVVSAMLQHDLLDQCVLGVAFDGTGFGPDGTVWGGEFLLATTREYQRVARLRVIALPGGEQAVREPWRVAVALLVASCQELDPRELPPFRDDIIRVDRTENLQRAAPPSGQDISRIRKIIHAAACPVTSSLGRLFDGIACLVTGLHHAAFEAEAAMRLEGLCDHAERGHYVLPLSCQGELPEIDWRPLIRGILTDLRLGLSPGRIAMKFHRGLAEMVFETAAGFPDYRVVLSGGCFQNRVLTELVDSRFRRDVRWLGLPGTIPVNDGGLAAGQIVVAAAVMDHAQE